LVLRGQRGNAVFSPEAPMSISATPSRSLGLAAATTLGLLALAAAPAAALDNGLARTPPMGWNSWNKFHCGITETIVKQTADAMVSSGMRDAGYLNVVTDDCWSATTRDSAGNLRSDPTDFPSGMKSLGDYIHARGLKFGIYTSLGDYTCTGKTPGSLGHEMQDAKTLASWGVDYVKVDKCGIPTGLDIEATYVKWRDALAAAGRPILFNASDNAGTQSPWLWGMRTANQWRLMGDITDTFSRMLSEMDKSAGLAQYAGPGGWNDPDMLEVGNGGMTDTEYRFHFGMWAMLCAPLQAGNDVRSMTAATKAILLHNEIIAVNQDPVGYQARKVWDNGAGLQIFNKIVQGTNVRVAALLNRNTTSANVAVSWSQLGLPSGSATVRDLWARTDRGSFSSSYTASVPAHGIVIVRIASGSSATPTPTPRPTATPVPTATPTPCSGCTLSGYYRIMARHSGKAMVVQGASTSDGANVFQWTYGGTATNDEWLFTSLGSGYYKITARHSGKALVVQSASTTDGANVFQWTYGGTATNDEWSVVDLGGGYYRVTNRNSGKVAEVVGGGTTDGTNIAQATYSGATYQQFQIISVP
jgi:alpha-galactosidase